MHESLLGQIKNTIYPYDINNAYTYNHPIVYIGSAVLNSVNRHQFLFSTENAITNIYMKNNQLFDFSCSCQDYLTKHSCVHIPKVLIKYEEVFININSKKVVNKSKEILEFFSKSSDKNNIKKELNVEYTIVIRETYWGVDLYLKLKIGEEKLYSVSSKYNKFIRAYYNKEGKIEFGKLFTYDPKQYYFNSRDEKILDFLYDNCEYKYQDIKVDDKAAHQLFNLLKNEKFYIENIGLINGVKEEMPIEISLLKQEEDYILDVNINKSLYPLTKDFQYILYNNDVYHLGREKGQLLSVLDEEEINQLVFQENDLDTFSKGILPIVKKDLILSEELKDLKILTSPEAKLYFDINKNDISCKVVVVYGKEEVELFDTSKKVLRNVEYETKIISDLSNYGFSKIDKKLILVDLINIVEFLENGINQVAEKYEVFTSEKLKNTKLMKKLMITSNFTIGTDNILHYDFDLKDISKDELSNIFKSLKSKKKYHKLKSGDIISLEDESLKELNDLVEEMDIDLKSEEREIPKYKAIYLDSIKDKKYKIIKTNNLFTEFINKFKQYKDCKLNFTQDEKDLLRPYQLNGVQWLYTIHKCDLGGILADEMGLGKSIQTIYFFKKLLEEDKTAKFLIVCPTALVYNWFNEFKKFAGEIKVDVFVGNKNSRIEKINGSKASVYITSYGTLREDSDLYNDKNFKVCVIDEAQNIKNPLTKNTKVVKKIKADTKFALTGTPVENSISELWSIFDFIMPGFLSSLNKFNEKYKFKELDDEASKMIGNLNQITAPFILRRKKMDVAKDLPDKIENNIYIDLSKEQRKLYAAEIKKINEEMDEMIASEGFVKTKFLILQLLTKLRQLCIDPKLVFENYKGESTKIDTLIKVIKEAKDNGHKLLLFSSFKSAFDIIRPKLEENNISFYTIDGSVSSKNRQELVNKFNKDNTDVFLITLKSGGTGLNLTSADVVIHLDLWWNPQVENQATDRAHRIGQKNTVEVIKLIANGTIEEKIFDLQKRKQTLSDKLIEKQNDSITVSDLTENDIRELLTFENNN